MASSTFLIAGLGNPGPDYRLTRHNVGFLLLDAFAEKQGWTMQKSKMQGDICRARYGNSQILLVKPQTYMNRSGECLQKVMHYYKVAPSHLFVIHDDLDLPFGKIKAVAKGGAGGHNGIRSIAQHLGSQNFARLKVGIGRPIRNSEGQGQPVERYVLSRFHDEELALLEERHEHVDTAITSFVEKGIAFCMNTINGRA